jgi:integrase
MRAKRGRHEGAIRQRPDGRWEARASLGYDSLGKRIRRSVYGATKGAVQRKLAVLLTDSRARTPMRSVRAADFFISYLDHVKMQNAVATWRLRQIMLTKYVMPGLGPLKLASLTPQHVAGLLRNLHERNIGKRTIQVVHATLRAALSYAVRLELADRNVAAAIPSPRADRKRPRILSLDDARRLLRVAREQGRDYPLYLIALTTGMRQGEILALTWDKVNLEEGRVRIDQTLTEGHDRRLLATAPKTSSSRRSIDLPVVTTESLKELRRAAGGHAVAAWVFTDRDGGPLRKSNLIRRSFKPLLVAAGLPDVTFHSLRHVANSILLAEGESAKVAAERLGHSSTRMTLDTYAHVLPTTQRAAAARLDVAFGQIGGHPGGQATPEVLESSTPRKRKKPARSKSTGFPVVVEVRRLELLTPYMRSKCSTN